MSDVMGKEPVHLPATSKQLAFARKLAQRNNVVLDWDTQQDRWCLSRWIDEQVAVTKARPLHPSSKQVAFCRTDRPHKAPFRSPRMLSQCRFDVALDYSQ